MDFTIPEAARSVDSLLDQRTQLVGPKRFRKLRGWKFSYWPECSEASVVWVELGASRRSTPADIESRPTESGPAEPKIPGLSDPTSVPVEDASWKIANGRARSRSRRYFVRNRLRFMWVLTFAESRRDRAEVMTLVSDFARRLRSNLDVKALPYWYSPELHPGGHGWHVNFFVSMYLSHARVADLWGHGFVWVTDFEQSPRAPKGEPLGMCRTPREGWRRAAAYGCKYAQKDWKPGVVGPRIHRYEVAQGFAPQVEKQWIDAQSDAWNLVAELVSTDDWAGLQHWDSNDESEWDRPPVLTFRW